MAYNRPFKPKGSPWVPNVSHKVIPETVSTHIKKTHLNLHCLPFHQKIVYNEDMDFILVFKFITETFRRENIDFALIGGFALQAAGVTRTTLDIDMLILSSDSSKIKKIMLSHGYELIHESKDVLNFVGKKFELGRVDFLIAHRKYTLAMINRAKEKPVFQGKINIKVLKIEDQIGLKVQSSSNDPKRYHKDMADIRLLMENNYKKLDMKILDEYFRLFNRQNELVDLKKELRHAK